MIYNNIQSSCTFCGKTLSSEMKSRNHTCHDFVGLKEGTKGQLMKEEVNGPDHYHGTRVLEIINEFELGFELGNVVKYILRAGTKGSELTDLKKARFYLDWYIKKETEDVS